MTIYEEHTINSLYDLKQLCWSGALQRIEEAIANDIDEEFFDYIVETFDLLGEEHIDLTQVNDFIWFDCDEWLEDHKKDTEEDKL